MRNPIGSYCKLISNINFSKIKIIEWSDFINNEGHWEHLPLKFSFTTCKTFMMKTITLIIYERCSETYNHLVAMFCQLITKINFCVVLWFLIIIFQYWSSFRTDGYKLCSAMSVWTQNRFLQPKFTIKCLAVMK